MLLVAGLFGMALIGAAAFVGIDDMTAADEADDDGFGGADGRASATDDPADPGSISGLILTGEDTSDAMRGTVGDDRMGGYAGDDRVEAGPGDDEVLGGDGADSLLGGAGADSLRGDDGGDALSGGTGDDDLRGMMGDDTLLGGDGDDVLHGGSGGDRLHGGTGADAAHGGLGDDTLTGGRGADTLFGGWGDDLISGLAPAEDVYDDDLLEGDFLGGQGDADPLVQGLRSGAADGDPGDYLNGGGGDDTIIAGGGDIVTAGDGADDILVGAGGSEPAEIVDFETGSDSLLIVWDDAEGPEPEVELVAEADGQWRIVADGVSLVRGGPGTTPALSDIRLIGASEVPHLTAHDAA